VSDTLSEEISVSPGGVFFVSFSIFFQRG